MALKKINFSKGLSAKFILISVLFIFLVAAFLFLRPSRFSYPNKYKMNVTPVSGSEETKKYGFKVGGWCWLGGATMLLKHQDPSITFDKVLLFKEGGTSFDFYFPGTGAERKVIEGGEYHATTDSQMRAAKNLGYKAHLRIKNPLIVIGPEKWQIENWIKNAKQLRAEVKTNFLTPVDEIKHMVSQGYPVFTDSIPCGKDFNTIEGYEGNNFYVITPEPKEFGLTDPKGTCPILMPNFFRIVWYTKEWDEKTDDELLSLFRWHAELAPTNMRAFVNFMEEDPNLEAGVTFNQLYVLRNVVADYLNRLGYKDLAQGYKESAKIMASANFPPQENKLHRVEIMEALKKIADIEENLYRQWPSPVVNRKTDYLEYGGILITLDKETEITVKSAKEEIPEGKLVYEVYDIKVSSPFTLTFKYGVYRPANLLKGNVKIVKIENGQITHLDSVEQEETISAKADGSGKYALVLYPE